MNSKPSPSSTPRIRPQTLSWDLLALCFFLFALFAWHHGCPPQTQVEDFGNFTQGGVGILEELSAAGAAAGAAGVLDQGGLVEDQGGLVQS